MQACETRFSTEANRPVRNVLGAADYALFSAPIASTAPAGHPEGQTLLERNGARTSSQGTEKAFTSEFAHLADAGYSDILFSLQVTRQAPSCGPLFI
jgi:hypothetical protein